MGESNGTFRLETQLEEATSAKLAAIERGDFEKAAQERDKERAIQRRLSLPREETR